MAREADAALQLKILQVGFVLVFIGAVLLAVKSLMSGAFSKAGIIVSLFIGLAVVLILDERYWLMLPVLSISRLSIPGLPFDGTELGCLVVFVVHCFRMVVRRDERKSVLSRDVLATVPLLLWMFIVWMLNPVGLAMFQSRVIGGRFYFDIAVGFLAFLTLASLQIKEKDARYLFYAILLSQLLWLFRGILFPQADPDSLILSGSGLEQEVSARYAFITCSAIFVLLFAKWSLREIMASPMRIALFLLLALLVAYSGKRQAFGTIVLVPFFRLFLTRKDVGLTIVVGFLAAVLVCAAVAFDGSVYTLPRSAKRALAVVFPRYERETAGGIHDVFRQEMRKQAYCLIDESPVFGRKGFAMDLENTGWMKFGGGHTSLYAGHAYSGNWHNMWLAYACDFGLPGLFFAICFWIYLLRFVFHENRLISQGVYLHACFLFFSYQLLSSLVFSWVSGHASRSTYMTWIQYGMLLALLNGYQVSFREWNSLLPLSLFEGSQGLGQSGPPKLEGAT